MTVPSGEGQGGPFRLRDWQKKFIRDVYEPVGVDEKGRDGRLVRRAILSIARKNGKTALIAALVLAHLHGPEAIENGEIFSAANDREQAAQVFKVAAQMVRADAELSDVLKVIDSTKTITNQGRGARYRALSAEAGTKHGANPSLVIFDELAQAKSRELYDVLDTSFGAQHEPLFITISTQSNDPEHILSKLIDDGLHSGDPTIVCHLYEVPEDCEDIFSPTVWRKANPALGDFRSLADLKAIADKAARMPSEEPKFRNLYLNQRYSADTPLISRIEWAACAGPAEFVPGERVYLGLDLSSVSDLTALVMVSAESMKTRVRPFLWKPADWMVEHSNRDFGTGNRRYLEWRDKGFLLETPGKTIDKEVVARKIAGICAEFDVVGMAYDRWRIEDLLKEFERIGFAAHKDGEKGDGLRLVPWGQGFRDMSPAVDAFEQAVLDRKLEHPSNHVLTWNVANARVGSPDEAGNRKLDKKKARFRIDGAVALAMALGLKARDLSNETPLDILAMVA